MMLKWLDRLFETSESRQAREEQHRKEVEARMKRETQEAKEQFDRLLIRAEKWVRAYGVRITCVDCGEGINKLRYKCPMILENDRTEEQENLGRHTKQERNDIEIRPYIKQLHPPIPHIGIMHPFPIRLSYGGAMSDGNLFTIEERKISAFQHWTYKEADRRIAEQYSVRVKTYRRRPPRSSR